MLSRKLPIAVALLCLSSFALGQDAPSPMDAPTVLEFLKQSMEPAMDKLTTMAIKILGSLAVLQFFITNYKSLTNDGDIQVAIKNGFVAVAWVGIVLYFIQNGPGFIQAVGDQMFGALGLNLPSPGKIIQSTLIATGGLFGAAVTVGIGSSTGGSILTWVAFGVFAIGMFFAFKIFMLHLELGLVAMMAPLSFSLLGLSALRDQGIAPFKALVSLVYRIILLTVILSVFTKVSDVLFKTISSFGPGSFANPGKVIDSLIGAIGAYFILAFLTFKSDSIAATLASGSTSMGTGDIAQAAAAGAALGATVASGGAAAMATGGKAPQAMSDFMSKMMGGGGSVSNASPMGSGGGDAPSFTPPKPSLSAGGGGSGAQSPNTSSGAGGASSSKPPSRSQGNSAAAPQGPTSVASGRYGPDLTGEAPRSASEGADGAKNSTGSSAAQGPKTSSQDGSTPAPGGAPTDPAPGSGLPAAIHDPRQAQGGDAPQHQGPRKPTFGERMGEANQHVSQEQAATHISINTHSD